MNTIANRNWRFSDVQLKKTFVKIYTTFAHIRLFNKATYLLTY